MTGVGEWGVEERGGGGDVGAGGGGVTPVAECVAIAGQQIPYLTRLGTYM